MKRSKGFTLIELLVVVAIIALLVSILLPTLGRARELAKQAICGSNLKSIGTAWALYGNEANDNPPILPDVNFTTDAWNGALKLGTLAANSGPTKAIFGGVPAAQQNLCLLVYKSAVNWNHFLCPSVGTTPPNRSGKYGMGDDSVGKSYCDYGIQIPYKSGNNVAALVPNMNGSMVIMADRGATDASTSVTDTATKWSPNHPDDGENALNAGFSNKFIKDKGSVGGTYNNAGGYDMNNIYTTDTWAAGPKFNTPGTGNGAQTDATNGMYDSIIYSWK